MDEQALAAASIAVVAGRVTRLDTAGDDATGAVNTYVFIDPSEVIAGTLPAGEIVLREPGGDLPDRSERIFGRAEYVEGEDVIVFLSQHPDGALRTTQMAMGKYTVEASDTSDATVTRSFGEGVAVLVPTTGELLTEISPETFARDEFVARVRAAWRGPTTAAPTPAVHAVPPEIESGAPREFQAAFTFLSVTPARWFEPDTSTAVPYFVDATGDAKIGPAGSRAAADSALAAWSAVSTTSLLLIDGGQLAAPVSFSGCSGGNRLVFNDPFSEIIDPVSCGGTLAIGGYCTSGETTTVNGTTFRRIMVGKVTFSNGFGACPLWNQCNLAEVATHELGHTIGLGHSADTTATMYAGAHFDGRCASLRSDDVAGVTFIYPRSDVSTGTPTLPQAATATATATSTATSTSTPLPTASQTPSPSSSQTPTRTATALPSPTLTASILATATQTQTPSPSRTLTGIATPTFTATTLPTSTFTSTAPAPPTSTPTLRPTASSTVPPTFTATQTGIATSTATASLAATSTPTSSYTPTGTATPTRTDTPTASASATPTVTVTASTTLHVSGRILHHSSDMPVPGVTVRLGSDAAAMADTATASDGQFEFMGMDPADWQMRPQKSGDARITALDAVYALQAAVGLRSLDTMQRLACDVSGDGTITAIDAALMLRHVVGIIGALPVAQKCGSDWVFMPQPSAAPNQIVVLPNPADLSCQNGSVEYNPLAIPADGQDFSALLFGDCSGSWTPTVAGALVAGPGPSTAAARLGHLQQARRSHRVRIPVYVTQSSFNALSLEIDYNTTQLLPRAVRRGAAAAAAMVVANRRQPGVLAISLASATPLQGGTIVVLEFTARQRHPTRESIRIRRADVR